MNNIIIYSIIYNGTNDFEKLYKHSGYYEISYLNNKSQLLFKNIDNSEIIIYKDSDKNWYSLISYECYNCEGLDIARQNYTINYYVIHLKDSDIEQDEVIGGKYRRIIPVDMIN